MKNLIIISGLFLLLFSCTEEPFSIEETKQYSKSPAVFADNGVLHLADNYLSLVDSVLALPVNERIAWEESLGFTSYNTAVYNLYEKLDQAETREAYEKIVKSNSSLVFFDNDSTITKTVPFAFFGAIANENKEFVITNIPHILKDDGIYEVKSEKPVKIMSFEDECKLKCGPVGMNGVYPTGDRFCRLGCVNNSNPLIDIWELATLSDRRVFMQYSIYRIPYMGESNVNAYRMDFTLKGEIKKWLVGWKPYKTLLHIESLTGKSLSYDVRFATDSRVYLPWYSIEPFGYSDLTSVEVYEKTWTWEVKVDEDHYDGRNTAILVEPWFDEIHFVGGSRGIGNTTFIYDRS
ncbi:hypothetical protein [Roseimarinus sediminis]|uniref:hypothetical protein n=1 Tax=Roseimarinus sediminis TaxID=1610899 RepID=UPI003D1A0E7B